MPRRRTDALNPAPAVVIQPSLGRVEWYAPAGSSDGWLLGGTVDHPWSERIDRADATFDQGMLSGAMLSVFFSDADSRSVRFLAFFMALRPPVGRLRRLESAHQLRLDAADARMEDPILAGAQARGMLHGLSRPGDVVTAIRGALAMPAWTGVDSLTPLGLPLRLVIDAVIKVPPHGLAIEGALLDPTNQVVRLALRQGGASHALEPGDWAVMPRPELTLAGEVGGDNLRYNGPAGFLAYAEGPFIDSQPCCMEVETRSGAVGHLPLPAAFEPSGLALIEHLLGLPRQPLSRMQVVMSRTIGPVTRALNRARLAARPTPQRVDFGQSPQLPERSLIIPLHGRLDFMAMQLALFSARPDPATEIIYVLDDPRLAGEAERLAHSCWMRFALPFSVIDLRAHLGYSPANNAGLAAARAGHVCLLNADVFPRHGEGMSWLEPLCQPLSDPRTGAVGATLLFEDNTLQHAGMEYGQVPGMPPWPFPQHPGKGAKPAMAAKETVEVTAVTGACLALRRADLLAIGGLDEDCIIADFEDASLCEALRRRGHRIMLKRDVVLYHLERQTPGSHAAWRFGATLVNASHFAARWNPDAQR